jgi:hypothetical protein
MPASQLLLVTGCTCALPSRACSQPSSPAGQQASSTPESCAAAQLGQAGPTTAIPTYIPQCADQQHGMRPTPPPSIPPHPPPLLRSLLPIAPLPTELRSAISAARISAASNAEARK